ncbi:MAG: hypothetical protein MJA27_34460 [Pseudanabaenales cyanobacterium]|nr:hypothetical protein [Pseudanabaenales cyanobacterium]
MKATRIIGHPVRQSLNGQHFYTRRIGLLLLGSTLSMAAGLVQSPTLAEEVAATSSLAQISTVLLDIEQAPLDRHPREEIERNLAITQDTISATSLTPPSLWWSRDQITAAVRSLRNLLPQQWLEAWVAYRGSEGQPRRVDMVVNPQIWNQLNYLERYSVLNQLGAVAKSYGYSTRIFRGSDLTGAYICDFSQYPDREPETTATFSQETLAAINCMIELDYRGRGSIRGNPSPGGS